MIQIPDLAGDVLEQLRSLDPQPFALLAEAADLAQLKAAPTSSPAGYVFETDAVAGENQRMGDGLLQIVEVDIAIVLIFSNLAAEFGAAALDDARRVEPRVLEALLGWTLPGTDRPLSLVSATTVKAKAGEIWRELKFATSYTLTDEAP